LVQQFDAPDPAWTGGARPSYTGGLTAITSAEGTAAWARARPSLERSLYLLNVLNGALPSTDSAMLGHGTRAAIAPQLAAVAALLGRASAPALLGWDGTEYWQPVTGGETGGPAWTPALMGGFSTMGDISSAALRELMTGLSTRAREKAQAQLTSLETYLATLGDSVSAYFNEWQTAIADLVTVVHTHATGALSTVATAAGQTFYRWCQEWSAAMSSAWQAFRAGLTLSAFTMGALPVLLIALALLWATRKKGRR
jgi:hypothetical protein